MLFRNVGRIGNPSYRMRDGWPGCERTPYEYGIGSGRNRYGKTRAGFPAGIS